MIHSTIARNQNTESIAPLIICPVVVHDLIFHKFSSLPTKTFLYLLYLDCNNIYVFC